MTTPDNSTTKFNGLNAYKALMLEPPLIEAWVKRYSKLANCLVDTNVPKSVLLSALKQQFAPKVDKYAVEDFAQHIHDTNNFLLPILFDNGDAEVPVLYAVPQSAFRNTKVISMSESLFINVPWWEPDEIRMLTLKHSEPALIWTHSKNNDFTFVGDHIHFRHAAPRENLLAYELIYVR